MKRVLCLIISVLIIGGCSKAPEDMNSISMWHWMTDRDEAFQELALKYKEETGVEVKINLYAPSDSYTQKITASAQARILPDIYGILDKKEKFAGFINNGFVADLTAEFVAGDSAWEGSIFPKALNVNRFEEGNTYGVKAGIYGVPIDVTNIQMLYNENLLKKAGIPRPPKTFPEFIEAGETLNRMGIPVFVSGWSEMWLIDCFASNYAFNIMGEEKVLATFRGEVPYTDPDWIKVLNVFKELTDKKILMTGIVTKPNKEAEEDFALERAAFAFNGSWAVNVYNKINPNLKYGVMLPPEVTSERPLMIWGGAGSSFVVNGRSNKKDKAIAFLKWLTDKDQQSYLAEKTKNLPSNKKALESIPTVLAQFASVMDNTTHPSIWSINELPLVVERFNRGIQSILIGEKTPEEVVVDVQEIKIREMEKAEKRKNR